LRPVLPESVDNDCGLDDNQSCKQNDHNTRIEKLLLQGIDIYFDVMRNKMFGFNCLHFSVPSAVFLLVPF